MTRLLSLSLTVFTLGTSLVACNRRGSDDDLDDIEVAADSTSVSQSEATLLAAAVDGSATASLAPATAESAAIYIASHAPQRFIPAGCATATVSGATVTLAVAGCTGPRGLRQLDGTLVLDVSTGTGGAVVVDATASDFQVGLSTLDIDATATFSVAGSSASLAVTTRSTGVGPLGRTIEHTGEYTVIWTETCVAIDGAWSTEIGEAGRSTTADLMRCIDECPTGSITRDTFRGRVITLELDGTPTAHWSTSAGRSGTFSLACGL